MVITRVPVSSLYKCSNKKIDADQEIEIIILN